MTPSQGHLSSCPWLLPCTGYREQLVVVHCRCNWYSWSCLWACCKQCRQSLGCSWCYNWCGGCVMFDSIQVTFTDVVMCISILSSTTATTNTPCKSPVVSPQPQMPPTGGTLKQTGTAPAVIHQSAGVRKPPSRLLEM